MASSGKPSENAPFFVDNERIVLNRDGVWLADGTEITHEGTRRLFARSLRLEPDGWWLIVGRERKQIEVADTPYFVERIEGAPERGYVLFLNDETSEPLDPASLAYKPGRLSCRAKGEFTAKFLRAPYFDLLKHLQEDDHHYYLTLQNRRFELARKPT
ncbi:MAG: DUF1285 domain-containing protein [Bacteriovoracia bacterium]